MRGPLAKIERRAFLRAAASFAAASFVFPACGAPATYARRIPRVAVFPLNTPGRNRLPFDDFRAGLGDRGFVEGETVQIEWPTGTEKEADRIVAEMIALPVDVLIANGTLAQLAVKCATSTIPTVILNGNDPVEDGIVQSLARPGGNITGIAPRMTIIAKRMELLKEAAPGISRVGIVSDDALPRRSQSTAAQESARALGMDAILIDVRVAAELPAALEAAARRGIDALFFIGVAGVPGGHKETLAFAAARRFPASYPANSWTDAGGLLVFGDTHVFRQAGGYVARILNGERPADMPIDQPREFELIINLRAARELGITIAPSVLSRATKVIE